MQISISPVPRRFAVIGSGASGCYAVEALLRQDSQIRIDVIERLPTPFGLIRYGVAPDHQGTKAVMRTLERFLAHERVRYFGSVTVGRDISLEEVMVLYDGVVIAGGVNRDRKLGLPGEELRGVLGSGVIASWYNDHPEAVDLSPLLAGARRAVVIGAGNVALDVARQFAKRPHDYHGTDMSPLVEDMLSNAPLDTITLAGRCEAAQTKFSLHEFKELARIAAGRMTLDPQARHAAARLEEPLPPLAREILTLPDIRDQIQAASRPSAPRREVQLRLQLEPVEFLPAADTPDRVGAIRFRWTCGPAGQPIPSLGDLTLPADLVVTCVGYDFHDRFGLGASAGVLHHVEGRIKDRLYVVGWAKRGPSGTIGTNRLDSHAVVAKACAEVPASAGRTGAPRLGIEPLLRSRGLEWIDFASWKQIDKAEIGNAAPGRVRRKLNSRAELLAVGSAVAA